MRIGEIVSMTWEDVRLEERYMTGGSKTEAGRNRLIPIHEIIVPVIESLHYPGDEYLVSASLDRDQLYRVVTGKLARHARKDIPGFTPHCTRHAFITAMNRAGVNHVLLGKIVGHSVGVGERTYTHVEPWEAYGAVMKITKHLHTRDEKH